MSTQELFGEFNDLTLNGSAPVRMMYGHKNSQTAYDRTCSDNCHSYSSDHCQGNTSHSPTSDERFVHSSPKQYHSRGSTPLNINAHSSPVARPRQITTSRDSPVMTDYHQPFVSADNSPNNLSPKTISPGHHSPGRVSPGRHSPNRASPKQHSPNRASPDRHSPARVSPDRHSPSMYSTVESWSMAQDFLSSGSGPVPLRSHHRRSVSHKGRYYTEKKKYIDVDEWELGDGRPRVASMPCRGAFNKHTLISSKKFQSITELSRLRSFSITSKGVVDEGYYFVNRSRGAASSGDPSGDTEQYGNTGTSRGGGRNRKLHKVYVIGSEGVGKRALIRDFVCGRDVDNSKSFDDDSDKSVSILLDGEESTMEFVDKSDRKVDNEMRGDHIDAYVVVYSVEDRRSFEAAINRLYEIRETAGKHVALILVANKTDLVRSRLIQEDEGKAAANTYDSKYIEVSAAIDHKIDELLVGVLKQIRLINKKYHKCKPGWKLGRDPANCLDSCCLLQARENVLAKIFKGEKGASKSCNNLYVL